MMEQYEEVLSFWFGTIKDGFPVTDRNALWWAGKPENDQLIVELFRRSVQLALKGELDHWAETPRGRLALIILLDQFTRTIYRGGADAFAGDAQALALCQQGLEYGHDKALELVERVFFYMPLEHAEDIDVQHKSVFCFEQLVLETPGSKSYSPKVGWILPNSTSLRLNVSVAFLIGMKHWSVVHRLKSWRFCCKQIAAGVSNSLCLVFSVLRTMWSGFPVVAMLETGSSPV